MPRGAQDLGNAIYAAHITWRQVGPLARYFNAYAADQGVRPTTNANIRGATVPPAAA